MCDGDVHINHINHPSHLMINSGFLGPFICEKQIPMKSQQPRYFFSQVSALFAASLAISPEDMRGGWSSRDS